MNKYEKLSPHIEKQSHLKVAVLGAGAVGSIAVELLAKAGVGEIVVIDKGTYEEGNLTKCSSMIRQEDMGMDKATVCAKRAQPLMVAGSGKCYGYAAPVQRFGPGFYKGLDYIMVALDNFAAIEFVNTVWKQMKEEDRPRLIKGATVEECCNVYFLSGEGLCLRCLFDESWLNGDAAKVRHSCTDGAVYRPDDDDAFEEHAPTSYRASEKCAGQMIDYMTANESGNEGIMNTMAYHYPFPTPFDLLHPLKKANCPDCRLSAPAKLRGLEGSVMDNTLEELKVAVMKDLGTDEFAINVQRYVWAGVTYSRFVAADSCLNCNRPMKIGKHEYFASKQKHICPRCKGDTGRGEEIKEPECLRAFSYKDHRFDHRTLFSLGYPIGAFIEVMYGAEEVAYYTYMGDSADMYFAKYKE